MKRREFCRNSLAAGFAAAYPFLAGCGREAPVAPAAAPTAKAAETGIAANPNVVSAAFSDLVLGQRSVSDPIDLGLHGRNFAFRPTGVRRRAQDMERHA